MATCELLRKLGIGINLESKWPESQAEHLGSYVRRQHQALEYAGIGKIGEGKWRIIDVEKELTKAIKE